ncbi:MAG: penicillin-binding protein activator [Pseudomonadota bacterium]
MFAFFTSARKALVRALAPLALVGLAACDPGAFELGGIGTGQRIDTSEPIPVALLVPRGGTATDNLLATDLENAARLAIASAEDAQIDLRVYGTAGNAATAGSQAALAVADGAKIIIGPLYAEAANAAGVAAAQAGVNVLAFSNNPTIAGGNVFVLGNTFDNTANRLVSFAARQGKNSIVVVHGQDVAGQIGRNAIQAAIARSGATVAGTVDYPLSQQGVVAAVPRIRSAVQSAGADAVFMTASSAGALPLLAQLMPEQGIDPAVTQYIGLTRWDIPPQTLELPGVQGGWFALPDPARSTEFRSRFEAAYGKAPHPLAGIAFDGIAAVTALASRGRSDALTASALTQGAGFQGATGVFRLRADGTNERGLAIATVRGGQVVVIDAAPQGFGGFGS